MRRGLQQLDLAIDKLPDSRRTKAERHAGLIVVGNGGAEAGDDPKRRNRVILARSWRAEQSVVDRVWMPDDCMMVSRSELCYHTERLGNLACSYALARRAGQGD